MPVQDGRKIYSVSEITRLVKSALEQAFGDVWIEGELSNVRRPSSGHYYLTIKDENAQISAVLFRGSQRGLKFELKDGLFVRGYGQISVYEKSGNYQIILRLLEEGGKGALQARFEALKEKLKAEGLFETARKRPLPLLPRRIGIVTSPTGAAIRDILKVLDRRFPNINVVLVPVKVQGEGAAEEIAAGIGSLNRLGGIDVMIIGRGGGSLEDLWCFNEEVVARAIFSSVIPVISAVGHEIDFTISDFTADMRAPTPSAAAELVVGRKDEFAGRIEEMARRLATVLRERLLECRSRLNRVQTSYVFTEPVNLARRYMDRVDRLGTDMARSLVDALRERQQKVDDSGIRISHIIELGTQAARQEVKRLSVLLNAFNPLAVLKRGYSITKDESGRIVCSAGSVKGGQVLVTVVDDGSIESVVSRAGAARR